MASSLAFMASAMLLGYGFAAIDFAFGDDRWREGRVSIFPLVGTISTTDAFTLGMTTLGLGFLVLFIGSYIFVVNFNTIKHIPAVLIGVFMIALALWGWAFSWNTIENRITHDIDEVGIPCPWPPCTFTSEEWLFINFGLAIVGFGLIFASHLTSRYTTVHYY